MLKNKKFVRGKQKSLSTKYKVYTIAALFMLLSLSLLGLSFLQSETMNSVRSYVRGEGLYSKAQKDAVFHLQRYARLSNSHDYQMYLQSLQIPLGDHQARLILQSDNPDLDKAYKFFLAGHNHPDDIDGMIYFFLRFEDFPYMREAIAIWTAADKHIAKLQVLGKNLRTARENGDRLQTDILLKDLEKLNWQLADLEYEFSLVLSQGARWVKKTLMLVGLGLLVSMLIAVLIITRRIITGIEKTEKDLLVSERRFRSLYQSNMLGILDWHGDGRVLDANQAFLSMLGYQDEDIKNGRLDWRKLTPADGQARDEQALIEIAATGFCTPFEKEFFHQNGHRVPVYLGAALLDGEQEKGICFAIDQTERKHAEENLRLYATVFDASSNGILITNEQLRIIAINKAFSQMSGYEQGELLGQSTQVLRSGLMPDSLYNDMWATLSSTGHWHGDMLDRKQDGSIFPIHLSINTVYDSEQKVSHYVAIFTDISERKAAEEKLRRMAHYDFLTGLANRSLFNDRLNKAIQRAKRHSALLALLFFDLDNFKPVNDAYGHEVGDKLLQEIATRIKNTLRENDTVARLGGDEFVILLEDLTHQQAAAEVANKIIASVNNACHIDGHTIQVSSSIGISIYPENSEDSIGMTRCADIAMYAAKTAGRNCYHYYNQNREIPDKHLTK